jgi:hypothetical protein
MVTHARPNDAAFYYEFPPLRQGDGFSHRFDFPADPDLPYDATTNAFDLTLWTFAAKAREHPDDGEAVTITVTTPDDGALLLTIPGETTEAMSVQPWVWELEATLIGGESETWGWGVLPVVVKVAR